jgi:hypothetical protein
MRHHPADQGEVTAVLTARSCGRARAIARVAPHNAVPLRKPTHQNMLSSVIIPAETSMGVDLLWSLRPPVYCVSSHFTTKMHTS